MAQLILNEMKEKLGIQDDSAIDIDQVESKEVDLAKRFSKRFTTAVSSVDQETAFALLKKLSNYLEDSGKLEQ